MAKKTEEKKGPLLEAFVSFKDSAGYNKFLRVGTVWESEKSVRINIETLPVDPGNWDGNQFILMKPDGSDLSKDFPRRKTDSGKNKPIWNVSAGFDVPDGRSVRRRWVPVGVAFHGALKEDSTTRSIILTIEAKPIGFDTETWDEGSYTGSTPREFAAPQKDANKTLETAS